MELQIGINTGQVYSGIMGEIKPQFSIYGNTVTEAIKISGLSH
jgi:class 3 adenylate cyclase